LQASKKIRDEEFSCTMHEIFKQCKVWACNFIHIFHCISKLWHKFERIVNSKEYKQT
jgi:hypothetical protein